MRRKSWFCGIACWLGIAGLGMAQEERPATGRMMSFDVVIAEFDGDGGVEPGTAEEVLARVQELEQQGQVDVLTRIRLTAVENQEAMVQVGEEVPIVTGRTQVPGARGRAEGGGFPFQQNMISMRSVGTLLQLTARVEAGGDVVAELQVQKSRIADRPPAESESAADTGEIVPPKVVTLTSRSTVRIPQGKTVLAGGMQESRSTAGSQSVILVSASVLDQPGEAERAASEANAEGTEIRIFHLQDTDSVEAVRILQQVFDQSPMRIAADERTNAVIVQGPPDRLEEVEALLMRLDETEPAARP